MKRVPTFRPTRVASLQPRRNTTKWRAFINSPAWRRCARSYLRRHPACVWCEKRGDLVEATNVHHTRGQDMEHAFDEETFEALCSSCHSRQTRQDMNQAKGQGDGSIEPEEDRPCTYG
jgi:HNH endonuclease